MFLLLTSDGNKCCTDRLCLLSVGWSDQQNSAGCLMLFILCADRTVGWVSLRINVRPLHNYATVHSPQRFTRNTGLMLQSTVPKDLRGNTGLMLPVSVCDFSLTHTLFIHWNISRDLTQFSTLVAAWTITVNEFGTGIFGT